MANLVVGLTTFFVLIALLAIIGYQLMCLADLEFDYTDPYYDSASRINKAAVPEFVVQAVFCVVCLWTGQVFLCFMSLPYLRYNIKLYRTKKHLVDVNDLYDL
ncbi:protein cornichon homolog 4-like [Hibiscus syriacus]|uniref:protein cornichon homolog 4-like n=1 Tax=Hibiscus syriacus TaxID=106335 RepID=UPI001920E469|nr:protein cornichon homolog 4-like [Hibiscus syriacus]